MPLNRVFPQQDLPQAASRTVLHLYFPFHEEAKEELTGKKNEPVPIIL
jgi:hypothetical protein